MEATVSRIGRFERSFMFHMILEFFLLLVAVACIELGIRYAALRYDFSKQESQRVEQAAQQLANDVKSIMLNSGGPTAAATVYPILNRAYDELGLSIAVIPSETTVESMRITRNMEARGLPANFTIGEHKQAATSLQAEQFCLGCHVKAKVGDVLGTVMVRSYLDRKEDAWWKEARVTAGALSLKILAHTILLFLLLKVRMEPLLALRTTVSRLAKGVMDLSPRASVKTDDEFGELALDLNHFLDRIGVVVVDLDKILSEVVSVGGRLGALNRQLEKQLDGMRDSALRTLGEGAQRGLETQLVAARESGAFDVLAETLDSLAASGQVPAPTAVPLRDQVTRLRDSFARVTQALQQASPPIVVAQAQSAEYQAFALSLREMAVLEATMQTVAESGQQLLARISKGKNGSSD